MPGQFLILDYDRGHLASPPYAQLAVEHDGFYLEVVSAYYVPTSECPLNTRWLRSHGWSSPDADTANWWRTSNDASHAARALVTALTVARSCRDPDRFSISMGSFPPPPGGGEPTRESEDATVAA